MRPVEAVEVAPGEATVLQPDVTQVGGITPWLSADQRRRVSHCRWGRIAAVGAPHRCAGAIFW
jgi:L-alanine-DL-glutamate epimerase-like enolase superfamily enzyme